MHNVFLHINSWLIIKAHIRVPFEFHSEGDFIIGCQMFWLMDRNQCFYNGWFVNRKVSVRKYILPHHTFAPLPANMLIDIIAWRFVTGTGKLPSTKNPHLRQRIDQ